MSIRTYLTKAKKTTKKTKEKIDWSWIEKPMNGQEIADKLGITRSAVSQTLKRALTKVYEITKKDLADDPFDAAVTMATMFNPEVSVDSTDLKDFFKLFPPKIRKEIEESALKRVPFLKGKVKEVVKEEPEEKEE